MSTELMMTPEKKKHKKKDETRGQTLENPILIKRYDNRKLYNTQENGYVTMPEVVSLIESNQFIKSTCNKTKSDLTGSLLIDLLAIKMKETLDLNNPKIIEALHSLIKKEEVLSGQTEFNF